MRTQRTANLDLSTYLDCPEEINADQKEKEFAGSAIRSGDPSGRIAEQTILGMLKSYVAFDNHVQIRAALGQLKTLKFRGSDPEQILKRLCIHFVLCKTQCVAWAC